MALSYEFILNGETLDATIGSMVYDKLEEALDEAAFHLPITTYGFPKKILGLLEIKVTDNQLEKKFNFLIISDEVSDISKDGFFEHNLIALEYTHKLDKYFVSALTFTQPFIRNARAPFEYFIEGGPEVPTNGVKEIVPRVNVNETYKFGDTITIPLTDSSIVAISGGSELRNTHLQTNLTGYSGTYDITSSTLQITIPENEGNFYIDIGYIHQSVFVKKFRHYFRVIPNIGYSLYDMLNRVRAMIPIERESQFDRTRIFNLEESLVNLFKSIEMPQMFFRQQTARQVLNTMFKYINAISRLRYEQGTDNLTVDFFNKIQGAFDSTDIKTFEMTQNAQDYGTRAISFLSQTLQTNFRDNPSVITASNNLFKIVRAKNIQLTDSDFELKLEKPIYELYKVEVMLPKVKFEIEGNNGLVTVEKTNFILDITSRFIERTLWQLKNKTLDIFSYPEINAFAFNIGLRENQGGNIPWDKNSNSINLSILFGSFIKESHLVEVVQEALNEEMTLRIKEDEIMGTNITGSDLVFLPSADYRYFLNTEENAYRNISFNIEYSTLDDTVIRQERLDTEFVNYNSDVRVNNFQTVSDYGRVSRDLYGKIERSAIPNKTISKIHTSLSDILNVGQIDSDNYIITERKLIFHNEFIEGVYTLTRNHNRLNEFNGINQEYRAFEIPSFNEAVNRLDFYSDYIYIVNPNQTARSSYSENDTTIYEFKTKFEKIFSHINGSSYITQGVFGNDTKITYAFIRTDGFLKRYPDTETRYSAIMTPVVSFGGKNNLNFNFKFENNQIAGDSITPASVNGVIGNIGQITNYYNEPIRYTDEQGFFEKLWFGMASNTTLFMFNETNKFPDIAGEDEKYFNDLYAYPLVAANEISLQQDFLIKNQEFTNPDWFLIYKDAATNYGFSYQLNIIPLDFNDYIIGQNFYTENPLVMNQNEVVEKKLYIYNDGTTYNMFDDLQIKSGYSSSVNITPSNLVSYIDDFNYLFEGNALSALSGSTSWAIGDNEGNLFLACNKPYTGFKLLARHNKLDTFEIGTYGAFSPTNNENITFSANYSVILGLISNSDSDNISFVSTTTTLVVINYELPAQDENIAFDSTTTVFGQEYFDGSTIDENIVFDSTTTRLFSLDGQSPTVDDEIELSSSTTVLGQEYLSSSTQDELIEFNSTSTGTLFIIENGETQNETISFNSNSTVSEFLISEGSTSSENISFYSAQTTTMFLEADSSTENDTISFNGESTSSILVSYSDFAQDDTMSFVGSSTGQATTLYNLRGYATATPINIVVDFDDIPAFSYTLQTYEQLIGTKPNNTEVTVTAPNSYILNGTTYTFVDWRVDETSETSTNRVFTTTINQDKTLRLRYVAFAFN